MLESCKERQDPDSEKEKLIQELNNAATDKIDTEKLRNCYSRFGLSRVFLATALASFGYLVVGVNRAYPSPAIPDLNAHANPFHVTEEEQSWFVSTAFLSSVVGSLLAASMVGRLGRKTTIMLAAMAPAVGWPFIMASANAATFIAGRTLVGLSDTIYLVATGLYVIEIAPRHVRGFLVTLSGIAHNMAYVFIYVLGAYIHWNWLAVICLAPVSLSVILMTLLPETPRWLLMKGKVAEAADALVWLRASGVREEFYEIQTGLKSISGDDVISWVDLLRRPYLKYFAISQGMILIDAFSGINIVRQYTVTIFQSAGFDSFIIDPYKQTIVIGIASVIGNIVGALMAERFFRKFLLIASTAIMGIGWLALGCFFFVRQMDIVFAEFRLCWFPLLSLVTVSFGHGVGVLALPYMITNELFPTRARGRVFGLGEVTFCLGTFMSMKCFASLIILIGDHGAFWVFAGFCFAGGVFSFVCVPETKGKGLEDIQKEFNL